jgi:hypothetical protein
VIVAFWPICYCFEAMKATVMDAFDMLMVLAIIVCCLRGFWQIILIDKSSWRKGPINSWLFASYVFVTAHLLMQAAIESPKPEVAGRFYANLFVGLLGLLGVIAGYARKAAGEKKTEGLVK